jgi:CBS domain-containing protein
LSSIFFDYEITFGEQNKMPLETLFLKKTTRYSLTLGNDALRKIHANLFKKFQCRRRTQDKFDIKRGLMPLIDGTIVYLSFDIRGINNTFQRFKQLAITDAKHAEVYLNCAEAFNFIKIQNFRRFKKR